MNIPSPSFNWQCHVRLTLLSLITVWPLVLTAGEISTDGTMGAAQTLSGTHITIPQNLGTTAGNNLFHSFDQFNIGRQQTVEFTGNSDLHNVISRVTGTHTTTINGTLKSSIANAAFFLINPQGITFGKSANVDVLGAFHVSTADKIDFANGHVLYADRNLVSTLSSEAPTAFGFLESSKANNGLLNIDGSQLAATNQTYDLVAKAITLKNLAKITSEAGEIRLVALREANSVGLEPVDGKLPLPNIRPSETNAGAIRLDTSGLDTSGNRGGRIALWGGDIRFTNSTAWADNTGAIDATTAEEIIIQAKSLSLDHSKVSFDALNNGDAGHISVKVANFLNIANGGFIKSSAGTVVYGDCCKHQGLAVLGGQAGNIDILAKSLNIDRQDIYAGITGIFSESRMDSFADAGNVDVNAGTIAILNGGVIKSSATGLGNAGQVTVKATDSLLVDSQFSPVFSGIYSINVGKHSGHSGEVAVDAETLTIRNSGQVSSATYGKGNARGLSVNAETLEITSGGQLSSSTFAQGNAGRIKIIADEITLDSQGMDAQATGIFSQAEIGSTGRANNIDIKAKTLAISDGGIVSSSTYSEGAAGNIAVNVQTLNIDGFNKSNNTGIFSTASLPIFNSSGQVGNIGINAANRIQLVNNGTISIKNEGDRTNASQIKPGTIRINTPDIDITNSEITTTSTLGVAAGNILLDIGHWLTLKSSFIDTTANLGDGGDITINNAQLVLIRNSGLTTTINQPDSVFNNNNGGNLAISADLVLMDSGLVQANAVMGSGGNITLNLKTLIPSCNSVILGGPSINWRPSFSGFNLIQAAPSSPEGVSGTITITAPQLNLSGVLAHLGSPQFGSKSINQDYCDLVVDSSLTQKGNGGLMPKGTHLLPF